MTSKTYAFLIFLFCFFFSLPHCCSGLFFLPFIKPCTHTHSELHRVISTVIRGEQVLRCPDKIWGRRRSEPPPSTSPPSLTSPPWKEERQCGGRGTVKLDLMSNRAAAFFVNICQIISAKEAIVVAGNCFTCNLKTVRWAALGDYHLRFMKMVSDKKKRTMGLSRAGWVGLIHGLKTGRPRLHPLPHLVGCQDEGSGHFAVN